MDEHRKFIVIIFIFVLFAFVFLSLYLDPKNKSEKDNFCNDESRKVESCITIYKPVCGFFDPEKIQCIKEPCANTYPNSCFACADDSIIYWNEGKCED